MPSLAHSLMHQQLKVCFSSITEIFVPNLIFIFIQGQIHMQYMYAIYECYFQFRNYIEFFVLFISFQKNWVQNLTGLEFASCCLLGFLFLFEKVQYTYYFRIHDVVSQDTYLVFTKFLWCKQISQRIYIFAVFRIPNGTSAELTNLLYGLLKRDAKDRLDFNTFFHHSFIRPPKAQPPAEAPMAPPPPPAPVSVPVTVPSSAPVSNSSTPKNSVPSSVPGALPPSPVAAICKYFR